MQAVKDAANTPVRAGANGAPAAAADFAAVQATLQAFLNALDRGEDALEPWFTQDATMYFPFRNAQALLHGRAAIVARFARMNAQLRQTRAAPPYIGFGMRDLAVEGLAPDWVLATAIFTFADQWGRRTLVLRAENSEDGAATAWRIHHLHASNLQAPSSPRQAP